MLRLKRAVEAEVDAEMRLHLEWRAEQLRADGWDVASADAEARRRLAENERVMSDLYAVARERDRRMKFRERLVSWLDDTRYAARSLARDPAFAGFAVLMLSVGIGANVTSFTLVDRLLVRDPAHVIDADRVVRLYGTVQSAATGSETSAWIPYPVYVALDERGAYPQHIGAYRSGEAVMGRSEAARRVQVEETLGGYFQVLGTPPLAGRYFRPDEDEVVAGPLTVLSESVWRQSFGGDRDILGTEVHLDGKAHTVVGIAPSGLTGTTTRRVDAWVLGNSRTARSRNWKIVARLSPGETRASAGLAASAVHAQTAQSAPRWYRDARLTAGPLHFGDSGRPSTEAVIAVWLAAVTAAILLVTFASVVNLLLGRLARRERELAVRVALGAGRMRVLRLLVLEGALLALLGGAASLIVAGVTGPLVREALFAHTAAWGSTLVDGRLLSVLAVLLFITTVAMGVLPAVCMGRPDLMRVLRSSTGGSGHSPLRAALTTAQAALSVVLLVGAGLFLRSMARVEALDLGVDPHHVLTVSAVAPTAADNGDAAARELAFLAQLAERARGVPGVTATSVAVGLPLDGGAYAAGVFLPGGDSIATLPGGGPFASAVDADYFATVGTALRIGRVFMPQDRAGSDPVIIINETMAQALWPHRNAVGQCVHVAARSAQCSRVVGVVADVHRMGLREQPSMQYYLPHGQQNMFAGATLLVRQHEPGAVARAQLSRVLPAAAVVASLSASLDGELRPMRVGTITFGLSAALALLVAIGGLYSLMSYLVIARTREISVRVAIGADDAQVSRLVIRTGMAPAAVGIVIGTAIAVIGGGRLEPHLFETSARDPLVLFTVAALLLAVSAVAGLLPARRALRINPVEALRAE